MPIGDLRTEADLEAFVGQQTDRMGALIRQLQGAAKGIQLHTTTATTNSPTKTTATFAALPEMTVTADFGNHPVVCFFSGAFSHSTTSALNLKVQLDGADPPDVGDPTRGIDFVAANKSFVVGAMWGFTPSTGSHVIDIQWSTDAATCTAASTRRQLVILELGNL